jgi:hypothetical protein
MSCSVTLLALPFFRELRDELLRAPYQQRTALKIAPDDTDSLEEIQMAVRDRSLMTEWGLPDTTYVGLYTDDRGKSWYFVKFGR